MSVHREGPHLSREALDGASHTVRFDFAEVGAGFWLAQSASGALRDAEAVGRSSSRETRELLSFRAYR